VPSIHALLADVTVLAVGVSIAWTALLALTHRTGGRAYERSQSAVIGLIVATALAGILGFATGARPTDGLHLLYGGVAIVAIPVARSFRSGTRPRDDLVVMVGLLVLAGVLYRLFATG